MLLASNTENFFNVFRDYNDAIWPMQIVFYLIALSMIFLVFYKKSWSSRAISVMLAIFWVWVGLVYYLMFFRQNTPFIAIPFGILFIVQAALFLYLGVYKGGLSFGFKSDIYGLLGAFFILFSLVLYPIIGYISGHTYPAAPIIIAPCPTTIFTFGLLLMLEKNFNKYLLIIPLLWALVGTGAVVMYGVYADVMLPITGIMSTALILRRYMASGAGISRVKTQA
jgi:hypothetical protein